MISILIIAVIIEGSWTGFRHCKVLRLLVSWSCYDVVNVTCHIESYGTLIGTCCLAFVDRTISNGSEQLGLISTLFISQKSLWSLISC